MKKSESSIANQKILEFIDSSTRKTWIAVDHILDSYDMRNLSKFYAPSGNAERAAHALLKLEAGSSIIILTGFCVTERVVSSQKVPVAENDGPPGTVLAGDTLRKLSYRVSYVADLVTCNILRACLKSIKAVDDCFYEFNSRHDEKEQVAEAYRLISQLEPKAMLVGELCSRNWYDGIRRNMRGMNINDWNPPVDEMLVQFKDLIPLALDNTTIIASSVYSDIPITSWNSNLGLQAVASIAVVLKDRFDLIPTADDVIKTIEAALDAGAVEGITQEKQENSSNGTYATNGVDGFAPFVHAADQDKLRSTLIQIKIKGML